ncbi:MAG: hypothetical protein GF308_09425 [Candidatus Heimdallarchaeota archaeon]|nr:hypothetical protein [Candidatus Heimdallarchaeota archaeon]
MEAVINIIKKILREVESSNKSKEEIEKKYGIEMQQLVGFGIPSKISGFHEIITTESFEGKKEIILKIILKQLKAIIDSSLAEIKNNEELKEKLNNIFQTILPFREYEDLEIYTITLRAMKSFGVFSYPSLPVLKDFLLETDFDDKIKRSAIEVVYLLEEKNRDNRLKFAFELLEKPESEEIYKEIMKKIEPNITPDRWDDYKKKIIANLEHPSIAVRKTSAKIIDKRGRSGEGEEEIIEALDNEKDRETRIKLMAALGRVGSPDNWEVYKTLLKIKGDEQESGMINSMLDQIADKDPRCSTFQEWINLNKPKEITNREKINLAGLVFSLFFNCLSIGMVICSSETKTIILWFVLSGVIIIALIIFGLIGSIYIKYCCEKKEFNKLLKY